MKATALNMKEVTGLYNNIIIIETGGHGNTSDSPLGTEETMAVLHQKREAPRWKGDSVTRVHRRVR